MRLEIYLRQRFHYKIRPLYIKKQCEYCGTDKDLHLHHNNPSFKAIVEKTLVALNIEMKDSEQYSEQELDLIEKYFLGEHLYADYITLCEDCHIKEHQRLLSQKNNSKITNHKHNNKKKKDKMQKRVAIIELYLNKKLDEVEFINLIKELFPTTRKKNAIKLLNELGYNVAIHENKAYSWTSVTDIITKY